MTSLHLYHVAMECVTSAFLSMYKINATHVQGRLRRRSELSGNREHLLSYVVYLLYLITATTSKY